MRGSFPNSTCCHLQHSSPTSKSVTFPIPVPHIPNSHTIASTPLSSIRHPFRLQVQHTCLLVVCFKFSQCQGRITHISLISSFTCGVMKEELHNSHLAVMCIQTVTNSSTLFGHPSDLQRVSFIIVVIWVFRGFVFTKSGTAHTKM